MNLSRYALPVIVLAAVLISALFAVRVPYGVGLNPDETAHIGYLQLMIAHHGLVHFAPPPGGVVPVGQPEPWETHQPPLYYLLCLPVYLLSGGNVIAVRFVSVALQTLTVIAVFAAVRSFFPERKWLAAAAAAFVAFLPTQARLSGAVNNDALTTLLCVCAFWNLGLLVRRGQQTRDAVVLALILGAGIWTKLSILQLLPAVAVAYFIAFRLGRFLANEAMKFAGIAIGGALLIGLPWFVRNTLLYGDPLAASIYLQTGPNFSPERMMMMMGWSSADYARNSGVLSFFTFWSLLPPNVLKPPPLLLLMMVIVAVGGMLGAYRWATRDSEARTSGEAALVGFFALPVALLLPFFVKFLLTTFQAQGRYFLPVLLPVAVVTLVGWSGFFENLKAKILAVAIIDGLLLSLCLLQFLSL